MTKSIHRSSSRSRNQTEKGKAFFAKVKRTNKLKNSVKAATAATAAVTTNETAISSAIPSVAKVKFPEKLKDLRKI